MPNYTNTGVFDRNLREKGFKNGWDPNYIFPLSKIGLGAYFLGVIYLMLAVVGLQRVINICKATTKWTITRTFYTLLFISLVTRGLAFWTISGFEVFNTEGNIIDKQVLYLWIVLLFMVPAYLFTSAYMLLFLVYVEIIIFSREQSVITRAWFAKTWRYFFYIVNSFLYIAQGMSYAGVFIFENSEEGREITVNIFNVLWLSNFILPLIALLAYCYITFRYAGFPFIDAISKERHHRMTKLFAVWSLCRVLSGLSLAVSTNQEWTQHMRATFVQMYVVAVAILTEGIPVLMVLNWSIVRLLERQRDQRSFSYHALEADWNETLMSSNTTTKDEDSEPTWQMINWEEIQLEKGWKMNDRGHGFFSLYRGRWADYDVVVKQFHTHNLKNAVVSEITDTCMKNVVSHPNINMIFGLSINPDGSFGIISRFWKRNSLFDIIEASPSDQAFAYQIVVRIGIQIAEAIEYLHYKGGRHGYLTTRNVLLDSQFNVKISDYNLLDLKTYCSYMLKDVQFEGYWTEPSYTVGKPVSRKSDSYAFGYILWEMYTKKEPFKKLSFSQIAKKALKGERPIIPHFMANSIKELTEWCWKQDPFQRPNFSEIKESLLQEKED